MKPNLDTFMRMGGVLFGVVRDDISLPDKIMGLPNHEKATSKAYIGCYPDADIRVGDVFVNPANERHYIVDVKTEYMNNEEFQLKCFYMTQAEQATAKTLAGTQIHVNNAYGSLIGNQNSNVSINAKASIKDVKLRIYEEDGPDKAQLLEVVTMLENIQAGKQEPKKGMFAKFAKTLEDNSWITGAIASTLLSWLTTL